MERPLLLPGIALPPPSRRHRELRVQLCPLAILVDVRADTLGQLGDTVRRQNLLDERLDVEPVRVLARDAATERDERVSLQSPKRVHEGSPVELVGGATTLDEPLAEVTELHLAAGLRVACRICSWYTSRRVHSTKLSNLLNRTRCSPFS